jgi:hypothetical protein
MDLSTGDLTAMFVDSRDRGGAKKAFWPAFPGRSIASTTPSVRAGQ